MNLDDIYKTLENNRKASVKDKPENIEAVRAQIAQDVENFLKAGGTITQVENGVIAEYVKRPFKIS